MLVRGSNFTNTPILSLQAGGPIAWVGEPVVDPDSLKIIAFSTTGPLVNKAPANILDVNSIREYSQYGFVIDSIDELVERDDVVKISKVMDLNFFLPGLKVESKKGSKMGKVEDFTVTDNDFVVQQLIVKRPTFKSFIDPELTIPRKEIVEVTDYKVIVKDEEKTIIEKAKNEDFVPNFVNPFRKKPEPDYAPAQSQNPDEQDN